MVNPSKPNVALITLPIGNKIAESFVTKSLKLLEPLCGELFLITGNFPTRISGQVHEININCPKSYGEKRPVWIRILRFLLIQLRISLKLIQISSRIDIALFHLGGELNLIPIFCSKLFGKKTALFYYGTQKSREMKLNEPPGTGKVIFPYVARALERIIFCLVDKVAVEAESTIEDGPFGRHKGKVSANGAFYVDTNRFKLERELKDRKELVGLICSLVPKKGVINLIDAIPLLLEKLPDIEFLIGGSGPLFNEIKDRLERDRLSDKVHLTGWLSENGVVDYLNQMKLFILPSYEEGVPNIILEAMACGTPVLTTPVGGIPDVIKDGKTGFILNDNSAESIARGTIRALNYPKLLEITKSARTLIESKYSYTAAVQRYENILGGLC